MEANREQNVNEQGVVSIPDTVGNVDLIDDEKMEPNPFEIVEKSDYENLEYALQVLEDMTARMNTS